MAIEKNQIKHNVLKAEQQPQVKKKATKKKKTWSLSFLRDERYHLSTGVFLILLSVYLTVSFVSYLGNYFTWGADELAAQSGWNQILFDSTMIVNNWGGRLGAAISWQLVKNGFGVASFLIPLITFAAGINLTLKKTVVNFWQFLRFGIVLLLWLSITLGFFFGANEYAVLAGVVGVEGSLWLEGLMGRIGTAAVLLFVIITFLVFAINFSFRWFSTKNKTDDKQPSREDDYQGKSSNSSIPRSDKYNTREFAIEPEDTETVTFLSNKTNLPEDPKSVKKVDTIPGDSENISGGRFRDMQATEPHHTKTDPSNKTTQPLSQGDVEFTVERTSPDNNGARNVEHFTIDTPYDPTLELSGYVVPTTDLLDDHPIRGRKVEREELEANKERIVRTLNNYSIQIDKIKATPGPAVTLYEIIPAPGIRISKIKNLEDDIALNLSALGIRIIAPIPGKGTIGIEVPNQNPEIVSLRSVLNSEKFQSSSYELPFVMGKTISNETWMADLTRLPHILMAGATGQGKSVGLNTIIASLLYRKHPSQVKFIMIDPKKVELTLYSKIERHFLAKLPDSEEAIITDTRKVVRTLNSLNIEMDTRYNLLRDAQVRNIKEYNTKFIARKLNPNEGHRYLPYLIIVIDEFADLIMTAGKEIELPLTRLAQLSRAIGIHLIIATQRPSVNIITGSIKANFPARFAFRVISKIDSRTILDSAGAEQLIGRGDLLISTGSELIRLQCAFVDIHEIERITDFIGSQRGYPDAFHLPEYYEEGSQEAELFNPEERDELFEDAARIIVAHQQGSTSLLQRKLKLGYNRAGRIIDQLEKAGIVGPFEGSKAREVKVAGEFALEQFLKDLRNRNE
ncbi:MAG TPA: DNA translocase FtsK [Bacteroidales bacterium]|nr:DNA translocase FtsK [Bacteroidales bacterium]